VLDNLRSGNREKVAPFEKAYGVEVVIGDILDRELVAQVLQGVDYVFHFAALISVAESMHKPIECNRINTEGTLVLLEECERARVKKIVFSSSAALYGNDPTVPKRESMPTQCLSPYAQSKLDGEFYVQMFDRLDRVHGVVLRYFNVFGPRQDPNSQYAAVIPAFVDKCVLGQDLCVFGDGNQTRDFVSVKDVVRANVHAALTASMNGGVFNVGYGSPISINGLAGKVVRMVSEQSGEPAKSRIVHLEARPGDVKDSMSDPSRLFASGWVPEYSFDAALAETVDYFMTLHGRKHKMGHS
jgi:UDP-glucose 4-epimerase